MKRLQTNPSLGGQRRSLLIGDFMLMAGLLLLVSAWLSRDQSPPR